MKDLIQTLRENLKYTIAGIVVIVLFLVSVRMIVNRATGLSDLVRTVQTKTSQTDTLREKYEILDAAAIRELTGMMADAEVALPQDKSVGGILTAFEILTQRHGLAINGLDLTPGLVSTDSALFVQGTTPISPGVEGLRFTLTTFGPLQSTQLFIRDIYTARRLFGVESVQLSFDNEEFVQANLSLLAYISPAQDISPAIEDPLQDLTREERNALLEVYDYEYVSIIPESSVDDSDENRFDFFNPGIEPVPPPVDPDADDLEVLDDNL